MAVAAYNLCVLLAKEQPGEATGFCRRAAALRPVEPKYAWTLAYYQRQGGDNAAAAATLEELLGRIPAYPDAHLLLADIYEQQGRKDGAVRVYRRALSIQGMPERVREYFRLRLDALQGARKKEE
jgi:Tfp pilus assembly protein PilF